MASLQVDSKLVGLESTCKLAAKKAASAHVENGTTVNFIINSNAGVLTLT